MDESTLHNTLKRHRERLGLSQQSLAERVGVTRQAILAIEAARQVPSTILGLQLAHALGCRVEELFRLVPTGGLEARLAPIPPAGDVSVLWGDRAALARIEGRWVAHRLPLDASLAADGLVTDARDDGTALVRPLSDSDSTRRNVLVAGCAPLLGALAQRVGSRFTDSRVVWLTAGSQRALELLAAGLIHVAGVHHLDSRTSGNNIDAVRKAFPGQRMLVVNLTCWRQGFVVPAHNPLGIHEAADLVRPGLRLARREAGAGAHKLVSRLLEVAGAGHDGLSGPFAMGHIDVARLVRCGAADVGVAIEGVALAAGLDFVPLAEERFDLVVPAALAERPPVSRLLDALDDRGFRTEVAHLPGYDGQLSGHVTTLEAT